MNAASLVMCWMLVGQVGPTGPSTGLRPSTEGSSRLMIQPSTENPRDDGAWKSGNGAPSGRSIAPATAVDEDPGRSIFRSGGTGISSPRSTTEIKPDFRPGAKTKVADASELLVSALTPSKEGLLAGKALSLTEAVARTSDRQQRLRITKAYWKLAMATAEFHWAIEEGARLTQITPNNALADSLSVRTARSNEAARGQEVEAAVLDAQAELADLLHMPSSEPLPLTSDVPLVGAYVTHFDRLFATRPAPARVRVIDRMLLLRRQAIELRRESVANSIAASEAAELAYEKGQTDLQSVIVAHFDLGRQRKAFLTAVREYNDDIAEYAVAVAEPSVSSANLVSMLIRTPRTAERERTVTPSLPAGRADASIDSGVVPATVVMPVPAAAAPNVSAAANALPSVMRRADNPAAAGIEPEPSPRSTPNLLPRSDDESWQQINPTTSGRRRPAAQAEIGVGADAAKPAADTNEDASEAMPVDRFKFK